MEKLPYIYRFQDLAVYKKSLILSKEIYNISKDFPTDELYSLTNQIRRSSRSIGAQISEAWAKRPYKRHFISKLSDADAELNETEHWVSIAYNCGYLSKNQKLELLKVCHDLGRMIGSMISKANHFCSNIISDR